MKENSRTWRIVLAVHGTVHGSAQSIAFTAWKQHVSIKYHEALRFSAYPLTGSITNLKA